MRYYIIICVTSLSLTFSYCQKKDTIYILFDKAYKDIVIKSRYRVSSEAEWSYSYYIKQKDSIHEGNLFMFSHFNQLPIAYKTFGGSPPQKLIKDTSFLRTIEPLEINFFRTNSYVKICETFESDDGWEQDVVIFIIDKDEIQGKKLVLREVQFRRPVKI
jgi:hypothetical protein